MGYRVRRRATGGWLISRLDPDGDVQEHIERVLSLLIAKRQKNNDAQFTFVQIGGYDGLAGDPIHDFITHFHWQGVICEPQPDSFAMLRQTYMRYPQVHLENAAVSPERGQQTLHYVRRGVRDLPDWVYQLSSFKREHLREHLRWTNIEGLQDLIAAKEVECLTLADLVQRYGLKSIDLMQIDTEGHDLEIIRSIDFKALKPSIIRYEHRHLPRADKAESARLLLMEGYQVLFERYDTVAFMNEDWAAG